MREILFRGKCFYNGKWVEGFIAASRENTYPNGFEMITVDGINYNELDSYIPHFTSYAVDPSTIGQYTGLKDKNGKKIFEGDIVRTKKYGKVIGHVNVNDYDTFSVVYEPAIFRVVNLTRGFNLVGRDIDYEVIGNIHDNHELLKEGDEQ